MESLPNSLETFEKFLIDNIASDPTLWLTSPDLYIDSLPSPDPSIDFEPPHELEYAMSTQEPLSLSQGVPVKYEQMLVTSRQMTNKQTERQSNIELVNNEQAPNRTVTVEIIEQPPNKIRFRYHSEGRHANTNRGVRGSTTNKNIPKIRIHNYTGTALIIVSCVTKCKSYRVHPHKLYGKNDVNNGIVVVEKEITETDNEFQLSTITIERVKRCDVPETLQQRALLRVPQLGATKQIDPFGKGFEHCNSTNIEHDIGLQAVRLAFQVFVRGKDAEPWQELEPVVTEVIFNDTPTSGALEIEDFTSGQGTDAGDDIMVIFMSGKVEQDDAEVIFYETNHQESVVWTKDARIIKVRNNTIVVRTPSYHRPRARPIDRTTVSFQVRRPSDDQFSNQCPFHYIHQAAPYSELIPFSSEPCSDLLSSSDIPNFAALSSEEYVPMSPRDVIHKKSKMIHTVRPSMRSNKDRKLRSIPISEYIGTASSTPLFAHEDDYGYLSAFDREVKLETEGSENNLTHALTQIHIDPDITSTNSNDEEKHEIEDSEDNITHALTQLHIDPDITSTNSNDEEKHEIEDSEDNITHALTQLHIDPDITNTYSNDEESSSPQKENITDKKKTNQNVKKWQFWKSLRLFKKRPNSV